jgi:beta-phosphoglucomutase
MKYKAIIFDMDGTIIDTEKIWQSATTNLLKQRGVDYCAEFQEEHEKKIVGLSLHKSCQILKDIANISDKVEDLIHEMKTLADNQYEEGIEFIDGFTQFHSIAKDHGLKKALATNAVDSTVEITKRKLNLEKYFGTHIYNISHVDNVCKPDPALYLHAAEKLGIDPKECIAIEDSPTGVRAACSAGMFCIGINTSKKPERLSESHQIIDTYSEIDLPKLLEMPKKK